MVDYEGLSEVISKEDLAASKDNLFDLFGELFNGETLKVILSETEGEIRDENKFILPAGYEEYDELSFNKNGSLFNIVLDTFIYCLMQLNPIKDERQEVYNLKIAIATIICLSGSITNEKNFLVSPIEFSKQYIKENKKEAAKNKIIKDVKSLFPVANNFVAFSTINYVRFNHHFPTEKNHIIKKVLLKMNPETTRELLEEDNKSTFYNILVSSCRVANELIFYEKFLRKDLKNAHKIKYKYYKILGNISHEFVDEMVNIRAVATPNGFLILDIIEKMILDLKSKKLLSLLPNIKVYGELLKIRKILRNNPLEFHPARYYFNIASKSYDEIREKFLSYMSTIGGFLYYYTESMEESISQAKCRIKYENKVSLDDKVFAETIIKASKISVKVNDEKINLIREKLNIKDIEIDENTDLEKENEACFNLIKDISQAF